MLVCASMAGAMDAMMVARTADWNLGIMLFDDDDDDVGLTFWLLLLTRQVVSCGELTKSDYYVFFVCGTNALIEGEAGERRHFLPNLF